MERRTILLVDDEPLILMDLEFAAEDCGCECLSASTVRQALGHIAARSGDIDVAVLDVTLIDGETCLPIAHELDQRAIPYILHSGDLDRRNETIRSLSAVLIPKPASSSKVIATAIGECEAARTQNPPLAAAAE